MGRPGFDFQVQDGNLMEPVPVLGVGNATPALTVSDVIPVDRCEQLFSNGNTDGQFAFASVETFQTCISRGLQDSETFAQPAAKFVPGFTCGPHVPFADREVNFLLDLLANATSPVPVVSMSSSRWTDIVALQRANGTLRSELKQRNLSDDAWKTLVTTFSSKGPTSDGRIKPDVVAPGLNISSARAGSSCGTMEETGTSMACPLTAGAVTLVRDYLSRKHNMLNPSGPLVKAALINGAQTMVRCSNWIW
jgi:subtilisin family serine protease